MSKATDDFDRNLKERVKSEHPYLTKNAAARAYLYNQAGVLKMTNEDFTEGEINKLKEARERAKQHFTQKLSSAPLDITTGDYTPTTELTTGVLKPVYNTLIDPMRMTVGSAWVAPDGQIVTKSNGELYKGDVYDFHPEVQWKPEYARFYKNLQKNTGRNIKQPMVIDLNIGRNDGKI